MKRFAASAVSVAAAWTALYFHETTQNNSPIDTAILLGIGVASLGLALIMPFSRRQWNIRSVGLFWMALASGVLFGYAGFVRLTGWRLPPGENEAKDDLVRAMMIVGVPAAFWGVLMFVRFMTKHRDATPDFIYDGSNDRRHDVRRQADRIAQGLE